MANDLYPGMTTVEEDFRELGLLPESRESAKPAPAAEAPPAEGEPLDEIRRIRKRAVVQKGGGVKIIRTHKTDIKKRMAGKRRYHAKKGVIKRRKRKAELGAHGAKLTRGRVKIARKRHQPIPGRPATRPSTARRPAAAGRARREDTDRTPLPGLHAGVNSLLAAATGVWESFYRDEQSAAVESKNFINTRDGYNGPDEVLRILEDVQNTVAGIKTVGNEEIVKAYASLALTAEELGSYFLGVAEDYAAWDLQAKMEELGELFADLAEDAATIAKALNENITESFDVDALSDAYRAQFALVLGGSNLLGLMEGDIAPEDFEDIFEASDEDEDEDEGDEDEEEGEDEEECEEETEPGKGE